MTPIDPRRCIAERDLTEPRLGPDGSFVVYAVATADEARLVLDLLDGGPLRPLATTPGLRAARGMGGGAWCFTAGAEGIVHVGADGNLWTQSIDGGVSRQLTHRGPDRSAASPSASPDGRFVAYVIDTAEVHLLTLETGVSRRIDDGADDFVLDPVWSPDGASLEWVAWNVPDMPWDHTVLRSWLIATGRVSLDEPLHALQQPRHHPDGGRCCIRDEGGWLNVHCGDRPVSPEPFEHAGPTWGPGACTYAWSPDGLQLAFTRNEAGFGRLAIASRTGGNGRDVARGLHGQLSWRGNRVAALRSGACTPTQVVVYDATTWERTVVAIGPEGDWADGELVEPELVEVPTDEGAVHGRLYRATEPARRLIVWLHGGPTDQWQVGWMPRFAFWRSRGWHVLVPDHRGSTGHGRDYQQALRSRWGELDVADTVAITRWAQAEGFAGPEGTVVMGGSAGGFTALLAAAAAPDDYAAVVVAYPVTDLIDMAERSHRFERHYTDTLVGPLPDAAATMRERSPQSRVDRLVHTPMLILHGDVDPVVPVDQSRVLAERVNAAGGHAELHIYEGEGHGFRQRANQLDEYRRVEEFLDRNVRVASTP